MGGKGWSSAPPKHTDGVGDMSHSVVQRHTSAKAHRYTGAQVVWMGGVDRWLYHGVSYAVDAEVVEGDGEIVDHQRKRVRPRKEDHIPWWTSSTRTTREQ